MSEEFEELFDNENPVEQAVVTEEPVVEPEVVEPAPDNVPEKFKGKSFEDVIDAYVNLEKEHGRKANEVGELRKLTDEILKQQVEDARVDPVSAYDNDLGFDEFIEDPAVAVDRALQNNPTIKALSAKLENDAREKGREILLRRHSDADDVVRSAEFAEWVQESPVRLRMLQESHKNYDAIAAGDLIDMYKTTHKTNTDSARAQRDAKASNDLQKAAVEGGGSISPSKKVYRRADLIRLKIEQPDRYAAMSDEIRQAYADGRVK